MRENFNAIDSVEEAPASVLPQAPTDDKDLGIVAPDHPPVQAQTNDVKVTHSVCHADVLVPGAALNGSTLYCPTCRNTFDVDQFDRRAQ